jgi:hypothetical protein
MIRCTASASLPQLLFQGIIFLLPAPVVNAVGRRKYGSDMLYPVSFQRKAKLQGYGIQAVVRERRLFQ